jgi:aminoglycoside phosphotransferase (APT) family kinase protein
MKTSTKTYAAIEIIPAARLRILPRDEQEDFLVMRRTEKAVVVSGLKSYLRGIKRARRGSPFVGCSLP